MDNRFVVLSLLEDLLHWPTPPPDDFSTEQPLQDDGTGRDENLLSAGSTSDHNEEPRSRQRARCHAVMHLAALAKKMGPRWTASEVVPYLLRCIEEEDAELGAAVAHAIVGLVARTGSDGSTSLVPLEAALPILEGLSASADEQVRRCLCLTTIPSIFFGCAVPAASPLSSGSEDVHAMLVALATLQHQLTSSRAALALSGADRFRLLFSLLDKMLSSPWAYTRGCAVSISGHLVLNTCEQHHEEQGNVLARPLLPRTVPDAFLLRNKLLQTHMHEVAKSSGIDVATSLMKLLFAAGTFARSGENSSRAHNTSRLRITVDASIRSRACMCAAIEAVPLLAAGGGMPLDEALLAVEDLWQPTTELTALNPLTEDYHVAASMLRSLSSVCSLAPQHVTDSLLADVLRAVPTMTTTLFSSRAWKVRFTAARHFCIDLVPIIFATVTDNGLGHTRLVPDALHVLTESSNLGQLFSDCEEEVRAEVALVAGNLVRHAASCMANAAAGQHLLRELYEKLVDQLLSNLQCAVVDDSDRVRAAAATSLATIALALGSGGGEQQGVERATNMLLDLVRDDQMVVQLAVIGEISNVLSQGGIAKRVQTELLQMCRGLAQHPNWRTREMYAKVLVSMCQHFLVDSGHHSQASAFAASELLPLLVDMLFDKAHAVRTCAAECTVKMCSSSEYLTELVWSVAKSSPKSLATYQARMTLLQLAIKLRLDMGSVLQPLFDQLGRDPVPNVRMVVAKELALLLSAQASAASMRTADKTLVLPLLRLLVEDSSADVRECAAGALEKCF